MAKLRRKCAQCGKVKTVKYRWGTTNPNGVYYAWQGDGNTYFCSDECALKWFRGESVTKCNCCEKPLSEGKGVYIRANGYSPSDKVYCSIECYLADRNIVPIEEVNQDKENHHGYIYKP